MITCLLPLPISTNSAYEPAVWGKRHGMKKTRAAKAWDSTAIAKLTSARKLSESMGSKYPMTGPIAVELTFGFTTLTPDIDGGIKAVLDACAAAGWFHNDNRIVSFGVTKFIVDGIGSVRVMAYGTSTGALTLQAIKNADARALKPKRVRRKGVTFKPNMVRP